MTVSLQIVGHSPEQDGTREIPDGSSVRITVAGLSVVGVEIRFPERQPDPPAWTHDADSAALSPWGAPLRPRQEA